MLRRALRPAISLSLSLAAISSPSSAQVIRPYHPRIFLSAAGQRGITPLTLRARCEATTSTYARACRVGAPLPSNTSVFPAPRNPPPTLINNALRYLLYNEDVAIQAVRQEADRLGPFIDRGDEQGQLFTNAQRLLHLSVAYDWLYDSLSPSERSQFEASIRSYAEYSLSRQPGDVFSSEAYVQAAAVGLAGLALAAPGDSPMAPAQRYLSYSTARWRNVLFPALGYTRGWWPEGPQWYDGWAGRYALYYAIAYTTATGDDIFAWLRQMQGDPFGNAITARAYTLRPDLKYPAFGDAFGEAAPGAAGQRAVLDMLAWATGSTVAQALANEVTVRLPVNQDYQGAEAWHQLVFYEPRRPARPSRVDLPLSAHLAPAASDVVVMRGSWIDEDAVHVVLSCGDWHTRRQHLEAGSFQIYRRAPLAVHTGTWDGFETDHWINWYAQRSAHANTLTVTRPGETFSNPRRVPSVNDGGQRSMPYEAPTRGTSSLYRDNLTGGSQFDTGAVTAFETSGFHDYAACDITRAYNSTAVTSPGGVAKVREVTRQVVLLRPELLVVFDRVEATDAQFERRFVMHSLVRPIADREGGFTLTRATGRLLGRTLLPANATRQVIEGYRVGDVTVNPLVAVDDSRGTRLEVSAPRGREREYFLHVLYATDTEHDSMPPASLIEDEMRAGVRVGDPSGMRSYTLMFDRSGPAGGEVRVQDSRGQDLYRGALGAGGTFYPIVQDAGVSAPDGSVVVSDGGRMLYPEGGGCSCSSASPQGPRGARLGALALAALGLWRRSSAGRRRLSG